MEPYHWIAKLFNSCYVIITAVSSYLTHVVNELKCWLFQPFRPKNRLHFILKVIAIGIATTFAWYFGWKGIELARKGIHATIQSNQLSAKQICASGSLSAEDQSWCNDFNRNVYLSKIAGARDWITASASRAAKRWPLPTIPRRPTKQELLENPFGPPKVVGLLDLPIYDIPFSFSVIWVILFSSKFEVDHHWFLKACLYLGSIDRAIQFLRSRPCDQSKLEFWLATFVTCTLTAIVIRFCRTLEPRARIATALAFCVVYIFYSLPWGRTLELSMDVVQRPLHRLADFAVVVGGLREYLDRRRRRQEPAEIESEVSPPERVEGDLAISSGINVSNDAADTLRERNAAISSLV